MEVDDSELPPAGANGAIKGGTHNRGLSTSSERMASTAQAPATDDDAASLLSTSSKSSFWPSLRRRTTDKSRTSTEKEQPNVGEKVLDDDASGLDFETELELQKEGKDAGRWGIGDEARMNLE